MGRPREHDEETAAELIAAAERLVAERGPDALSLRTVAEDANTTTRAIYSLFQSKDGLIAALAQSAFDDLTRRLDELPATDDPAADLIEIGVTVFRRFVLEHPSLFRIAFQRVAGLQHDSQLAQARTTTFQRLVARFRRCVDAGLLRGKTPEEAAIEFNALCEGLANAELRGQTLSILPRGREEDAWRSALCTLVRGLSAV